MYYLKQLGAGYPDEWTNPWFNRQRDFYDLDALCDFVRRHITDGHIGMRISFGELKSVCSVHSIKAKAFIDKCLPNAKYIYFTRNNLRQAVEALYYEQIQQFMGEPKVYPKYDIEKRLTDLAVEESSWEILFEKYQIEPIRVSCEDLVFNPEATCKKVLRCLDIDYPKGIRLIDRKKDALTNHEGVEAWYNETLKRYLKIMGV